MLEFFKNINLFKVCLVIIGSLAIIWSCYFIGYEHGKYIAYTEFNNEEN